VRVNGEPMKADVRRGIGTLFLAVPGPVSSITVDPTGDNARVCTDDIAAGVPVAAPASAP
jgi:hypothetical protein